MIPTCTLPGYDGAPESKKLHISARHIYSGGGGIRPASRSGYVWIECFEFMSRTLPLSTAISDRYSEIRGRTVGIY